MLAMTTQNFNCLFIVKPILGGAIKVICIISFDLHS